MTEKSFRTIAAATPDQLFELLSHFESEGWKRLGPAQLTAPIEKAKPMYWVQTIYRETLPPDEPFLPPGAP